MSFQDIFVGALTLNSQMFATLRERSDVFWRGFLVLLFSAMVAGAFAALGAAIADVRPLVTEQEVIQRARDGFERSYSGPAALQPMIEQYVVEGTSMVYEIGQLPPRAGEGARPIVAILDWIGTVLATPFSMDWMGRVLLGGLLFQLSARIL